MRSMKLVSVLAALALALMACQPAEEPATTDTPTPVAPDTPTPDEDLGEVDQAVLERLATAAANTVDEGTARFEIVAATVTPREPTDPTPTPDVDATPTPGTDTDPGVQTGMPFLTVQGQVDFETELRELEFQGPQAALTAIIDGSQLYMQLPATEDGQFARVDLDELMQAEVGFGGPAGVPFQDPLSTLEALREAVVEARVIGDTTTTPTPDVDATPTPDVDETPDVEATPTPDVDATPTPDVDGTPGVDATPTPGVDDTPTPDDDATPTPDVDATPTPDDDETPTPEVGATPDAAQARHIFVVIDLERAGQATPEANHFAAMAQEHGIQTIDMEVWIDEQDRIERIAYLMPLSEARMDEDPATTDDATTDATTDEATTDDATTDDTLGGTEPQQDLVVTITYTDFGTAVDIRVPDEDMVIDLDEEQLRQSLPQHGTETAPGTAPTPTPGIEETPTPTPSPEDT